MEIYFCPYIMGRSSSWRGMEMDYKKWYQEHEKEIWEGYFTYLRFPSVSAQKTHRKDLLACCDWLEAFLKKIGFKMERWLGKGHPVLFGEMIFDESAPTVLIYGHYDVQPAEPYELWKSHPFQPEIRNERVYARGAEDNKGQSFYTLTAIRAFLEAHPKPRLNLKVVMEGEEEMGSTTITEILPSKTEKLRADHLLLVDSGMGSFARPSLCIGARGIMTMEMKVIAMESDGHSGSLGGVVYSPIRALVEVLAKAINEKGKVTIPKFYDHITPLTEKEKSQMDFTCDLDHMRRDLGIKAFHSEEGYKPGEANHIRPAFEINGIWGGYTGDGFKTVLPKEASAKISCRLVPNQKPEQIFNLVCDFMNEHLPEGMIAEYTFHGGGEAAWALPTSKTAIVMKKVYEKNFGSCHFIFSGGSIPITTMLKKYSGADFVMPGTALECDNIHAPNESFGVKQFYFGFLMIAESLELFAQNK